MDLTWCSPICPARTLWFNLRPDIVLTESCFPDGDAEWIWWTDNRLTGNNRVITLPPTTGNNSMPLLAIWFLETRLSKEVNPHLSEIKKKRVVNPKGPSNPPSHFLLMKIWIFKTENKKEGSSLGCRFFVNIIETSTEWVGKGSRRTWNLRFNSTFNLRPSTQPGLMVVLSLGLLIAQ